MRVRQRDREDEKILLIKVTSKKKIKSNKHNYNLVWTNYNSAVIIHCTVGIKAKTRANRDTCFLNEVFITRSNWNNFG